MKTKNNVNKVTKVVEGTSLEVDSRVLNLFLKMAGDKSTQLLSVASRLTKEGKSPERALADVLESFRVS